MGKHTILMPNTRALFQQVSATSIVHGERIKSFNKFPQIMKLRATSSKNQAKSQFRGSS